MTRDPAVKAALHGKIAECLSWEWTVNPPEDPTPLEVEQVEFVRFALEGFHDKIDDNGLPMMSMSTGQTFFEGLWEMSQATVNGYSIVEPIGTLVTKGRWEGKAALHAMKGKNPRIYGFKLDKFSNVEAVVHNIDGIEVLLAWENFIIFPFMPLYSDPHGNSDLQAAYRAWLIKDACERFWSIATERFGMGIIMGRYPADADATVKSSLMDIVRKVQSDTAIIIPENLAIEIVEAKMTGGESMFRGIIDHQDKEIAKGIQGAFLQSNEGSQTGSRNMGLVHQDTANRFTWVFAQFLASYVTKYLVRRLIDWNWDPQQTPRYPTFVFSEPGDKDIKRDAEVADILVNKLGLAIKEEEAYERFAYTKPADGDEILAGAPAPTVMVSPDNDDDGPPRSPSEMEDEDQFSEATRESEVDRIDRNIKREGVKRGRELSDVLVPRVRSVLKKKRANS